MYIQKDLEVHDRVGRGRYIIGLGQDSMAFCTDVEDVISMRLFSYFFIYSFGKITMAPLPLEQCDLQHLQCTGIKRGKA